MFINEEGEVAVHEVTKGLLSGDMPTIITELELSKAKLLKEFEVAAKKYYGKD